MSDEIDEIDVKMKNNTLELTKLRRKKIISVK